MANVKISDLPATSGVADANEFEINESGSSKKVTGLQIQNYTTNATTVEAAGALMDSELTDEAAVKALDQGVATTDSPEFAGLTVDTDTLFVDASADSVGINNVSPSASLDVTGDVAISSDLTVDTDTLYVDSTNDRVGIGTSAPSAALHVETGVSNSVVVRITGAVSNRGMIVETYTADGAADGGAALAASKEFRLLTNGSEAMRIDSSGNLLVGTTDSSFFPFGGSGALLAADGGAKFALSSSAPCQLNRLTSDGNVLIFRQDGTNEGSISVSGSTVSYNGGHLSRWSRLPEGTDDTHIYKGTVMTNLDEMCEWSDEEGDLEDNEQLNKTTVSTQEGDPNVAGLFVAWDEDDDWGDYYLAMTGDLVIRIAQGVTVQRGDLLMSAGDGTAKPQDDDTVRSKTVAKVTSTHVSHTYPDGSYAVPCVVMAC